MSRGPGGPRRQCRPRGPATCRVWNELTAEEHRPVLTGATTTLNGDEEGSRVRPPEPTALSAERPPTGRAEVVPRAWTTVQSVSTVSGGGALQVPHVEVSPVGRSARRYARRWAGRATRVDREERKPWR